MTPAYAAPLSAVDTAVRLDDTAFEAVKEIDATDPYLCGHYPGWTVYPGVFTVETVFQAARQILAPAAATLNAVVSVGFTAPLHPGDRLTARCAVTPTDAPGVVRVTARCFRADGAAAARMTLELRVEEVAGARTP
ncbi:hypothetical protein [Actinokineospora sp.]|uniref:hypothetical protein n=1 Tax=Actinokineospora sp. TaxID=1872133 RepID=UPI003D6ADD52